MLVPLMVEQNDIVLSLERGPAANILIAPNNFIYEVTLPEYGIHDIR